MTRRNQILKRSPAYKKSSTRRSSLSRGRRRRHVGSGSRTTPGALRASASKRRRPKSLSFLSRLSPRRLLLKKSSQPKLRKNRKNPPNRPRTRSPPSRRPTTSSRASTRKRCSRNSRLSRRSTILAARDSMRCLRKRRRRTRRTTSQESSILHRLRNAPMRTRTIWRLSASWARDENSPSDI